MGVMKNRNPFAKLRVTGQQQTKVFKTDKGRLPRKAKHKGKNYGNL